MDEDHHDGADPDHVARYETGAPFRCLACEAIGHARRRFSKALTAAQGSGGDDDNVGQFQWSVQLVPNEGFDLHETLAPADDTPQ